MAPKRFNFLSQVLWTFGQNSSAFWPTQFGLLVQKEQAFRQTGREAQTFGTKGKSSNLFLVTTQSIRSNNPALANQSADFWVSANQRATVCDLGQRWGA